MAQITLYIDEETRKLVERVAKARGVSQSRWVVEAIRMQLAQNWPADFVQLAGSFPDFPMREDGQALPEDSSRIGW